MAKLTRVLQKIFGSTAGVNEIGKFGSLAAGSPVTTTDPVVIQALSEFTDGWFSAVMGENSPAIEDVNAIDFLYSRQLAYLFQAGVAEWEVGTTYYTGSLVSSAGAMYQSLVDNNTGNALTDATKWAALALIPLKQYLGNGGMDFAQRNANSAVALGASFAYQTADRWALKYGGAWTAGPTSQLTTTVPSNNRSRGSLRFLGTATDGTAFLTAEQRIESIYAKELAGGAASVSFWVFHNNVGNLTARIDLLYPSASDNYAAVTSFANKIVSGIVPGVWTKVTFLGVSIPSNVSAGMGVDIKLTGWDFGSSKNAFITQAMVYPGAADFGDSFIRYGGSEDADLKFCQRYYEKTFDLTTDPAQQVLTAAIVATPGLAGVNLYFPAYFYKAIKRVLGTVTYYNPVNNSPGAPIAFTNEANASSDISPTAVSQALNSVWFRVSFAQTPGFAYYHLVNDAEIS